MPTTQEIKVVGTYEDDISPKFKQMVEGLKAQIKLQDDALQKSKAAFTDLSKVVSGDFANAVTTSSSTVANASETMKKQGAQLEQNKGLFSNLSQEIGGTFTNAIKGAVIAWLGFEGVKKVVSFFMDARKEAQENIKVNAQLSSSLGFVSSKLNEQATALGKLLIIDDDEVKKVQVRLSNYTKEESALKSLTEAVMYLATAKDMDLTSAAEMVGRALADDGAEMAKLKIKIDGVAGSSERAASITNGLTLKFKDQAIAVAGAKDEIDRWSVWWDQLKEDFGKIFQPQPKDEMINQMRESLIYQYNQNAEILKGASQKEKEIRLKAIAEMQAAVDAYDKLQEDAKIQNAKDVENALQKSILDETLKLKMKYWETEKDGKLNILATQMVQELIVVGRTEEQKDIIRKTYENLILKEKERLLKEKEVLDKAEKDRIEKNFQEIIDKEKYMLSSVYKLRLNYNEKRQREEQQNVDDFSKLHEIRLSTIEEGYNKQLIMSKEAESKELSDFYDIIDRKPELYEYNQDLISKIHKKYTDERLQITLDAINQEAQKYGMMATGVTNIFSNFLQADINNINKRRDAEIKALDEQHLSSKQRAKKEKEIKDKAEEETKELQNQQKDWAIGQALISGALAVMKNFADYGLVIGGIMNAIQVGLTASEIAVINSQKFALGGDFVTNGRQTITVGDNPGGRERVQITPLSSQNVNGPQQAANIDMSIIVYGNVDAAAAELINTKRQEQLLEFKSMYRELQYTGQI